MTTAPLTSLQAAIAAEAAAVAGTTGVHVELGPPARPEHGDLATPVAMTLARAAKRNPREIAEALAERLRARPDTAAALEAVEVAGPGFLNLRLAPAWVTDAVRTVAAAGPGFGRGGVARPERILLEFVSTNPTGPIHIGHARGAAYGDSVGRILSFVGHAVTREYYINDHGAQMELFAASVAARYAELVGAEPHMPEGGYPGEYVIGIARALREELGDAYDGRVSPPDAGTLELFGRRGGELMLDVIRGTLERFRVSYDEFFSERTLHQTGRVEAGVRRLVDSGDAYEADGAVWFRTTAYGDEKDRVLVRSGGGTTYLAADVAYHLDKAARMGDRMIDVLGADHHGYIGRLRAVLAAGGFDPDTLEVLIMQLVGLTESGEAKRMSKRAGTIVLLDDLIDDIGVDAARFFLVERSHDTAFELDLDLAREQSQENPVYYVQYAHARCCSILAKAAAEGVTRDPAAGPPQVLDPSERALALRLAEWPRTVADAAERRAPHRVVAYLKDLSRDLHAFYHRCRVVGEAREVQAFRMELTVATRDVVRCGLDLVGVTAPDRM
ncbi:MAG: arginine--tRNA ligase [Thermoleophilia bacterium]|nr:arginine--tRNA ligase [Thermoleophilia bacterium]